MPDGPVLGAIATAPGVLFVGDGPYLKVLATSSGTTLFQYFDTNAGSMFWGPASISNGVAYVGNKDGNLFAFGF
jgi:outer membrane protein assembly factor BamB